jgi:type IV secretory pathway VirJ component
MCRRWSAAGTDASFSNEPGWLSWIRLWSPSRLLRNETLIKGYGKSMTMRWAAVMFAIGVATGANVWAAPATQTITVPTFGTVTIYQPDASPEEIVLFLSGDGGWNLGVRGMAERLRGAGALVVGIDVRAFMRRLESSKGCAYPAGALEELSRAVQVRFKLPHYQRPILVGYSSGSTLAYAAIAAAPPETFAGAISLGFCPDIELRTRLCAMRGLKATKRAKGTSRRGEDGYDLAPFKESIVPWMVLQGEMDQVCAPNVTRAFVAGTGAARLFSLPRVGHGFGVASNWEPQFVEAYRAIATARRAEEPKRVTTPQLADLSLVEVPVTQGGDGDALAILLTGDGGFADIDKRLAAGLSAHGVPVVAWSSLDYYWTPRSPAGAAADLTRIIEHFTTAWRKSRVLIVGYSFGADVVPFLFNRLPDSVKARVRALTLLEPSATASFEFHVTDWLVGSDDPRYPVPPEIERASVPVTCVSATDDADSVCRDISAPHVQLASVGRGHHFSGEYDQLLDLILQQITPASVKGRPVAAHSAPSLRSQTIGLEPAMDPLLSCPDLADFTRSSETGRPSSNGSA